MKNTKGVRKGAWTYEEDNLLKNCINKYGEGKWHLVPERAGLNRCRKSCRLRWLNYLSPNIKRGSFAEDEIDMIIRLHNLLGNRWSLIAGRLPGRTSNDMKNYWNAHLINKVPNHIGRDCASTSKPSLGNVPLPCAMSMDSLWNLEEPLGGEIIGSCSSFQEENFNMEFPNVDDSFWDNLRDFDSLWDLNN
ncbi:hypothetical protein P8452_48814 [Trifolium repens]|nr:hypothetical protein P8452_48814 [Trifolium repens]